MRAARSGSVGEPPKVAASVLPPGVRPIAGCGRLIHRPPIDALRPACTALWASRGLLAHPTAGTAALLRNRTRPPGRAGAAGPLRNGLPAAFGRAVRNRDSGSAHEELKGRRRRQPGAFPPSATSPAFRSLLPDRIAHPLPPGGLPMRWSCSILPLLLAAGCATTSTYEPPSAMPPAPPPVSPTRGMFNVADFGAARRRHDRRHRRVPGGARRRGRRGRRRRHRPRRRIPHRRASQRAGPRRPRRRLARARTNRRDPRHHPPGRRRSRRCRRNPLRHAAHQRNDQGPHDPLSRSDRRGSAARLSLDRARDRRQLHDHRRSHDQSLPGRRFRHVPRRPPPHQPSLRPGALPRRLRRQVLRRRPHRERPSLAVLEDLARPALVLRTGRRRLCLRPDRLGIRQQLLLHLLRRRVSSSRRSTTVPAT